MSVAWAWLALLLNAPQDPGKKKGAADFASDPKVEAAIRKGIAYLKGIDETPGEPEALVRGSEELLLLTFLHSGIVPETDPVFQKHFKSMMSAPLESTYKAALKAMVLEELHRVRFQKEIWECAQWLVDTQCTNGMWGYGGPVTLPAAPRPEPVSRETKTAASKKALLDFGARPPKPAVQQVLRVRKTRDGCLPGCAPKCNNSTAQYAALGLRACREAGIVIPEETIHRAIKSWEIGKVRDDAPNGGVATGADGGACWGWGYFYNGSLYGQGKPLSSITAGAVGSLVIYEHLLGRPWKNNPDVKAGMAWLARNFTVKENVGGQEAFGHPRAFHFYSLYALERLGVLYDTETIGRRAWYAEGAAEILGAQRGDGSWSAPGPWDKPAWDTCFAILFLKRGTRPLDVASVDRFHQKP